MKKTQFTILVLILISFGFLHKGIAQDWRQWNLPKNAKMRLGKGMINGDIVFSPDSSLLAVPTTIGIWIYDGFTGKELKLLSTHTGFISSIAFSPDSKKIVSCNYRNIHLWDVTTGNLIFTIPEDQSGEVTSVAFNPNGKTFATSGEWGDGTIKFWDVKTAELKKTFTADGLESITTITFSPDGTILASGSEYENIVINLWDVATGKIKRNLYGFEYEISDIAFNRDGVTLASSSGSWYFVGDDTVQLWNIATGKRQAMLNAHTKMVNSVSFSPDGKTLASGSDDSTICLWDVENGRYTTTLFLHRHLVKSVAFSPDGKTLASGSADGTVILWDTKSFQQRNVLTEHTAYGSGIDFSPNGQQIVTGCWDTTVRLWDTSTGQNTQTIRGHRGQINAVAFSPDGHTIASSGGWTFDYMWDFYDNTIRLWAPDSGKQKATLLGNISSIYSTYSVTFSPDGRTLASTDSIGKMILWDVATLNPLWTIKADKINYQTSNINVTFSPDGQMLATKEKTKIQLWDIVSRQLITTFYYDLSRLTNIVFSPDGKTLVTGDEDNVILLWDVASRMEKVIHTGHAGTFMRIAFSPDGRSLLTVGLGYMGEETARFWEPSNGMLQWTLKDIPDRIEDLTFSPDGETLATLGVGGTVLLWDYSSIIDPPPHEADVNRDTYVNIHDLVAVAANFGKTGANDADVNGDGVVNIEDLIKVASAINDAAAPAALVFNQQFLPRNDAIQEWITQAKRLGRTDETSYKGIHYLEMLLAALTPKKTALLPNYPNPFNPETWIPYQIAEPADVKIQIYSSNGQLIRTLEMGHQSAGIYQQQSRAAYWDGKNESGEPVASGAYFYTLTAGLYTATRKMLILK